MYGNGHCRYSSGEYCDTGRIVDSNEHSHIVNDTDEIMKILNNNSEVKIPSDLKIATNGTVSENNDSCSISEGSDSFTIFEDNDSCTISKDDDDICAFSEDNDSCTISEDDDDSCTISESNEAGKEINGVPHDDAIDINNCNSDSGELDEADLSCLENDANRRPLETSKENSKRYEDYETEVPLLRCIVSLPRCDITDSGYRTNNTDSIKDNCNLPQDHDPASNTDAEDYCDSDSGDSINLNEDLSKKSDNAKNQLPETMKKKSKVFITNFYTFDYFQFTP